jgi:hypothetical protein
MVENNTVSLTSDCKVVAQVSLSKMDWWQPLCGEMDDDIVVALIPPVSCFIGVYTRKKKREIKVKINEVHFKYY